MNILLKDGTEITVNFQWDMKPEQFAAAVAPLPNRQQDISDYCGAVFFGNYKLEFIRNDVSGVYVNMYRYGAENSPGSAYGYLDNGTPYEECDPIEEAIAVPNWTSFDLFANDIELQLCLLLCRNPEYIPDATVPTDPNKWYPAGHPYHIDEITRNA